MLHVTLFYAFSSIAIFSAMLVISSKNPVRAVLSLVLAFIATAANWMLLEVEFLSIGLIVIYVGAVMVLFLFVVMMIDIEIATLKGRFTQFLPLGIGIPVLLVILLVHGVGPLDFGIDIITAKDLEDDYSNVRDLGITLFTRYLFEFEIAGLILLVALVSAITLGYRGIGKRKLQYVSEQVKVNKEDRIKLIDMQP